MRLFIFFPTFVAPKMNKPTILAQPIEVTNRLAQLGVTREGLQAIIDRMVSARRGATANHPPGSAGWMAWSEGTCRSREIFLPLGWERNEESRISSIHKGQIRIAVCNTDEGTGLVKSQPMNRSKKGAGTDYVVSLNQGVFADILAAASKVIQLPGAFEDGKVVYWYLCVYCEGDTVRAELSCPLKCKRGFFVSFRERIILIGESDDDGGVRKRGDSTDSGPDFEIVVTRKSG